MARLDQKDLGPDLAAIAVRDYIFQNWAKTFQCKAEWLFKPETQAQVIQIVRLAKSHNKSLKVIGSGHSPSDLACTSGWLVSLDAMNNPINIDKTQHRITIQAGMSLDRLHQVLLENNMALCNLGSISDQSVAGAMATATHGTGAHFGCLSTMIVDMTLVSGLGNVMVCSRDENPRLFDAARCNLGALGIVTALTLQVEPAYCLEAVQVPTKLADVLDHWEETIHSAEHVRLWWFPQTDDDCVVWRANRVPVQAAQRDPPASWLRDRFVGYHTYQALLQMARFYPPSLPRIAKWIFSMLHTSSTRVIDKSHEVFNFDCLFPQYVNEWAIPWDAAPQALRRLQAFIDQAQLHVHFPIEIRFVDQDDIWLSPSYGRKTCYIGVIMYRPHGMPVPYKKYWNGYEEIMRSLGGRPHWAKAHGQSREALETSYPKFQDFLDVRREMDPQGLFLNDYLVRHLLPVPKTPITPKL